MFYVSSSFIISNKQVVEAPKELNLPNGKYLFEILLLTKTLFLMQLYTPVEYFQTRWVRKISSIGILSGSTMSTLKITRWLIAANVTKMINQKHQLPETNRPNLHGQRPKVMRMLTTLYRKWPSYRSWFRNAARALRT